jgi:hypothetical protein
MRAAPTSTTSLTGPGTRVCELPDATVSQFRTAVSLHAHTHHSCEVLTGVPSYLDRIPVVARLAQREVRSYLQRNGRPIDFSKGWWHPAVDPESVLSSERTQIRDVLRLAPLVSITDHDCVEACVELRRTHPAAVVPLSFEWTVPFDEGYFHLGVHNVGPASIATLLPALMAYTQAPEPGLLSTLLAALSKDRRVLLVFNHPLWDLAGVGRDRHAVLLRRLLADHGHSFHAMEVNGYRTREENLAVGPLACAYGLPLISGGDRHGRTANSLLNLTNARSFDEFAHEIREQKESVIVVMPEYRRALVPRKLRVLADTIRTCPSNPVGYRWWADRVSFEEDGAVRRLSEEWVDGGPAWVRLTVRAFQVATSAPMLPVAGALVSVARAASLGRRSSSAPPAVVTSQADPQYSKDVT